MYVLKPRFPEKLVGGKGQGTAHTGHCPQCIGARPQVGDAAQVLQGVLLLLKGVGVLIAFPNEV